jgi:SAM-dependent methyltransferase
VSVIAPALAPRRDSLATTIDTYDAIAESYASQFDDVDLAEDRARFLEALPRGVVLDAGCGSGRDCRLFARDGVPSVGIDISSGMLAAARRRTISPLVSADVRSLPFRAASFAGVWCCAVLLHLDATDFARSIEEFRRVLVDDGGLFVSVRHGVGSEVRRAGASGTRRFVLYKCDEVADLVALGGFDVTAATAEPGVVGGGTWINVHARCR